MNPVTLAFILREIYSYLVVDSNTFFFSFGEVAVNKKSCYLLAFSILIITFSCSDAPVTRDDTPSVYEDLKQKEHVIKNLELSIANRDLEAYQNVLHEEFQQIVGKNIRDRDRDLLTMQSIFNENNKFEIYFNHGEWKELNSYEGQPCDGCWETYRIADKYVWIDGKEKTGPIDDHYRLIIIHEEHDGAVIYQLFKSLHVRDADWDSIMTEWQ